MTKVLNTTLIGVSGGSGSGKSVFINDLRSKFNGEEVSLISQDNYYKAREIQKVDHRGFRNFDLPYSIDLDDFTRDILLLKEGHSVTRKEYCFNNPNATHRVITVHPAPVLLVEGLFIFSHQPIWDLLDLRVFIQASDSQRLSRRIIRDQMERNYPLEDVLYRYEHHVFPAYKAYIEPYYEKVDIVINNYTHYRPGMNVLESYIRELVH